MNKPRAEEVAWLRNRLNELLDDIGMPHTTGPVWEEESESELSEPEPDSCLPDYADPYIAERSGHLVITTWEDIYELPKTLWKPRGAMLMLAVSALLPLGGHSAEVSGGRG